ncbi:MAG: hypothetical protein KGR19_08935 [Acidobacteria bacterium]|nr:hypothetical protein [Acidobacteriota bacterium]
MGEEKPRDVRDTLGELEGQLRDLEGELRATAAGEAGRSAGAGPPPAAPPPDPGPRGRRPWIVAGVAAAVVAAAVLVAVLVSGGSQTEEPPPAEIALDTFPAGGDVARATAGLAGVRGARGDAGAEVCVGSAQAALVIERSDPDRIGCRGLQRIITVTASARGVADPSRQRPCLRPSGARAGSSKASGPLTRARARAQGRAERAAQGAQGTPSPAAIRAGRVAAARAGARFDRRRGLKLAAVRRGGRCVAPNRATLASGSYPLATRITLLAQPDYVESEEVRALAASLRSSLAGPVPVDAWVARR